MNILTLKLFFLMALISFDSVSSSEEWEETNYQLVVLELLSAIKNGESTEQYVKLLEKSTEIELVNQVVTDNEKIAFWVNVYNAYIQIVLKEHPEYYDDRRSFFKEPHVKIAGQHMSFADIEHGIIRGSQFEYFLGYIRNPFVAKYKKPIDIYHPDNLDKQFDAASKKFLQEFSKYDEVSNAVSTTPLFSWFRGDFGGKKGVKRILESYGVVPGEDVELSFDDYDWTLELGNFSN